MNAPQKTDSSINRSFLSKLRWMGFIEGTSTLVLFFIAMPLKHLAGRQSLSRSLAPFMADYLFAWF